MGTDRNFVGSSPPFIGCSVELENSKSRAKYFRRRSHWLSEDLNGKMIPGVASLVFSIPLYE